MTQPASSVVALKAGSSQGTQGALAFELEGRELVLAVLGLAVQPWAEHFISVCLQSPPLSNVDPVHSSTPTSSPLRH